MPFFWTEAPIQEMWQQLRYLKSPVNVANLLLLSVKSGRNLLPPQGHDVNKRAEEVSACIRQADEYYIASKEVSLITHPLLHFYGAESLVKAVVLANNFDVWLDDIKFHGLSSNIEEIDSSATQTIDIGNASAIIKDGGVFPLFCKAVVDQVPLKDSKIAFKDILKVIPDLSEFFKMHFNKSSNCFRLDTSSYSKNNLFTKIIFGIEENLADIITAFPDLNTKFTKPINPNGHEFLSKNFVIGEGEYIKSSLKLEGTIAGQFLMYCLENTPCQPIVNYYIGLFILSNLVRYKPRLWMEIVGGHATGDLSVVEKFCNNMNRSFPQLVLGTIWNEKFIFGSPAYLS